MQIDKTIFREYDIRGIAGVKFEPSVVAEYEKWYGPFPGITINLETSKAIGKAYGTMIGNSGGKDVVVGFEMRPYAKELKQSFVEGILESGINVIDAGEATTPLIYFLTVEKGYGGGVNITGSHNVYFYNGFKVMKAGTDPIYGEELQTMRQIILDESYTEAATPGTVTELTDGYEVYKQYTLDHISLKRPVKIVIDCGNGTAGLFARDYFEALGCEVLDILYEKPDPYFPNHVPDPEVDKNMEDLMARVKETGADIGIAFDADADRVGFVKEDGGYVFGDEMIAIYAKDVLSRHPGKTILSDVKCSAVLGELVEQFGGESLMHRTGHAPIKDTMRKNTDIVFAGEASGHFYFAEQYGKFDDGFWGAAQMLRILSEQDKPFSALFDMIPKTVKTPELKLPCEDSVKFDVVKKAVEIFSKEYECITLDGARIAFGEHAWGLVRASNTSPYLTIRVEGKDEAEVLKIKNALADVLDSFDEIKDRLDRENVASFTGTLGYI